ncbi:MAG: hypothetical protein R2865_11295 [Deinococcales bacterium]
MPIDTSRGDILYFAHQRSNYQSCLVGLERWGYIWALALSGGSSLVMRQAPVPSTR